MDNFVVDWNLQGHLNVKAYLRWPRRDYIYTHTHTHTHTEEGCLCVVKRHIYTHTAFKHKNTKTQKYKILVRFALRPAFFNIHPILILNT